MELIKIEVQNYRLLYDFTFDVEKDLSLVVGKNNCGKTSLLSVLDKFINGKGFKYDDFSNFIKKKMFKFIKIENFELDEKCDLGITLSLFIKYDFSDDLSNIRYLMLDLDPENDVVILQYTYAIDELNWDMLKNEYKKFESEHKNMSKNEEECFNFFMKKYHSRYFKVNKFSVLSDKKNATKKKVPLDLKVVNLNKIINFKYIDAKRNANDQEKNRSLSILSNRYYNKQKLGNDDDKIETINIFENTLMKTDKELSQIYKKIFEKLLEKVKKFGGLKEGETEINIISNLNSQELLSGNTTVIYKDNEHILPESYNGLGYLNLINMIFEIECLLIDFSKSNESNNIPADINLLFIEEPEAHTHPQMQYIFIKNIKEILKNGYQNNENINISFKLQTIITTHSSHIVSGSEFNDIKYFQRIENNQVVSKNLKQLEIEYKKEKNIKFRNDESEIMGENEVGSNYYKFLKQYLTLNYSEIFFADKAILMEGTTERVLLPAMMKKLDVINEEEKRDLIPLLSQNISIIEVGAHSQIFDNFIDFIGIKTLIITDIDFAIEKPGKKGARLKKSEGNNGTHTTNGALKHYFQFEIEKYKNNNQSKNEIDFLKKKSKKIRALIKVNTDEGKYWRYENKKEKEKGILLPVYQKEETINGKKYYARSFEDSFICLNREFLDKNKSTFNSLNGFIEFLNEDTDSYMVANENIYSKTSFAMDILLHSNKDYKNWKIPSYIKEGLLWLQEN